MIDDHGDVARLWFVAQVVGSHLEAGAGEDVAEGFGCCAVASKKNGGRRDPADGCPDVSAAVTACAKRWSYRLEKGARRRVVGLSRPRDEVEAWLRDPDDQGRQHPFLCNRHLMQNYDGPVDPELQAGGGAPHERVPGVELQHHDDIVTDRDGCPQNPSTGCRTLYDRLVWQQSGAAAAPFDADSADRQRGVSAPIVTVARRPFRRRSRADGHPDRR